MASCCKSLALHIHIILVITYNILIHSQYYIVYGIQKVPIIHLILLILYQNWVFVDLEICSSEIGRYITYVTIWMLYLCRS